LPAAKPEELPSRLEVSRSDAVPAHGVKRETTIRITMTEPVTDRRSRTQELNEVAI
jgi:hypothetical protein